VSSSWHSEIKNGGSSSKISFISTLRMVSRHLVKALIAIPFILIVRAFVLNIPYSREGFFCQDDEIRYPYYEDTVNSDLMFLIFTIIGTCLIVSTEYTLIRHLTRDQRRKLVRGEQRLHPGILHILYFLISMSCSFLATSTIVNLGKRTVSRLRPNFLAVCQPNLTLLCPPNTYRYVQDYECFGRLGEDEYFAFPSGHAAHSVCFAVFIIYYLQKRCKFPEPLRSMLQFIIFLMSFFISLSRVRDHKHRLADVLGGATIGFMTGIFFMNFVLRNFRINRYSIAEKSAEELSSDRKLLSRSIVPIVISLPECHQSAHHQRAQSSGGTTSAYGSCDNSSSENIYEPIRGMPTS